MQTAEQKSISDLQTAEQKIISDLQTAEKKIQLFVLKKKLFSMVWKSVMWNFVDGWLDGWM